MPLETERPTGRTSVPYIADKPISPLQALRLNHSDATHPLDPARVAPLCWPRRKACLTTAWMQHYTTN
jgi:hypothetical protein